MMEFDFKAKAIVHFGEYQDIKETVHFRLFAIMDKDFRKLSSGDYVKFGVTDSFHRIQWPEGVKIEYPFINVLELVIPAIVEKFEWYIRRASLPIPDSLSQPDSEVKISLP